MTVQPLWKSSSRGEQGGDHGDQTSRLLYLSPTVQQSLKDKHTCVGGTHPAACACVRVWQLVYGKACARARVFSEQLEPKVTEDVSHFRRGHSALHSIPPLGVE